MKLLSCNCQGHRRCLDNPSSKASSSRAPPKIVFLSEKKVDAERCQKIARQCTFPNVFPVDAINKAGGLCIMWQGNLKVMIKHSNSFLIPLDSDLTDFPCIRTCLCAYCPPSYHIKNDFWEELENRVLNLTKKLTK